MTMLGALVECTSRIVDTPWATLLIAPTGLALGDLGVAAQSPQEAISFGQLAIARLSQAITTISCHRASLQPRHVLVTKS